MRKIRLFIILFSMAYDISAQFYIQMNTGYSFSTQPLIHENTVITDSIMDKFKVRLSHGSGLNLGITTGYLFQNNFFGELIFHTTLIARSHSDNDWGYYFRREYSKLHLSGLNGDALMESQSIQISPSIGYSILTGKLRPFVKAGLNILYLKSQYRNSYTYKFFDEEIHEWYLEHTDLKREYTGSMKIGFRGSAGVLYKLSETLWLLADVTAINSMYQFNKSYTLTFKVDGVEKVQELQENPEKLKNGEGTVDFSNVGLNIGIRYIFN